MTIYPSYIANALPWEIYIVSFTLEKCTSHDNKLRDDLDRLELQNEIQQSVKILLEYLGKFIGAYRTIVIQKVVLFARCEWRGLR